MTNLSVVKVQMKRKFCDKSKSETLKLQHKKDKTSQTKEPKYKNTEKRTSNAVES